MNCNAKFRAWCHLVIARCRRWHRQQSRKILAEQMMSWWKGPCPPLRIHGSSTGANDTVTLTFFRIIRGLQHREIHAVRKCATWCSEWFQRQMSAENVSVRCFHMTFIACTGFLHMAKFGDTILWTSGLRTKTWYKLRRTASRAFSDSSCKFPLRTCHNKGHIHTFALVTPGSRISFFWFTHSLSLSFTRTHTSSLLFCYCKVG